MSLHEVKVFLDNDVLSVDISLLLLLLLMLCINHLKIMKLKEIIM
jgi:hypothetical protein